MPNTDIDLELLQHIQSNMTTMLKNQKFFSSRASRHGKDVETHH
jgi:hypothetical protein